jgi:hypothetical protein
VDGWVCVWHSYFVISSLYNHCRFCQFRQPGQCSGCYSGHEWLPDWHEETQSPAQTAQRRQPTLLAYVPSKWIGAHRTIAPHLKMHPSNFLLNNYKTKNHTETYHLTGIQIQIRNKLYLLLITSFVQTGQEKEKQTRLVRNFLKKTTNVYRVDSYVWELDSSGNGTEVTMAESVCCIMIRNELNRSIATPTDSSLDLSLSPHVFYFFERWQNPKIFAKNSQSTPRRKQLSATVPATVVTQLEHSAPRALPLLRFCFPYFLKEEEEEETTFA